MNDELNDNIKDIHIKYPSANLLLNLILREYEYELDKSSKLNSKVGLLLSLTGVFLTLSPSYIQFPKNFKTDEYTLSFYIIFIVLLLIIGTILISSVIIYLYIFISKPVYKINTDQFTEIEKLKFNEDVTAKALIETYSIVVSKYTKLNNKLTELCNIGIVLTTLSIVIMPILIILNNAIK